MDKTVAILARTNLALRPFEAALTEAGVRYHLVGKSGFWATEEVKSVLAYLGCCLYPADWLLAEAIRAPFWPTKFLPKSKLLARLKELKGEDKENMYYNLLLRSPETLVDSKNLGAIRDFTSFVHSLSRYKDLPAHDALKSVMSALKVGDYYSEIDTPDSNPLENLGELLKISGRHPTVKDFLDYVRRASAASKSKSGVALATCHAAKGLEWSTVYFVGVQEGILPHAKSDDLEGERNVWFVGCSRAEQELVVTYSGIPSSFLKNVIECKKQEESE